MNIVTYNKTTTVFFACLCFTIASVGFLLLCILIGYNTTWPGVFTLAGVAGIVYIFPLFWESLVEYYHDSSLQLFVFNKKQRSTTQFELLYAVNRRTSLKAVKPKSVSAEEIKEIEKKYEIKIPRFKNSNSEEWFICLTKDKVLIAKEYYTVNTNKLLGFAVQNVFVADSLNVKGNLVMCNSVSSSEIVYPQVLSTSLQENMYLSSQVEKSVPRETLFNYEKVIEQYDYALRKSRMNVDKLRPRTKYIFSGITAEAGLAELQPYVKYLVVIAVILIIILVWWLL